MLSTMIAPLSLLLFSATTVLSHHHHPHHHNNESSSDINDSNNLDGSSQSTGFGPHNIHGDQTCSDGQPTVSAVAAALTTITVKSTTTVFTASTSLAAAAAASSAPGTVLVQVVNVSDDNATLNYFPDTIDAPPGSIVQFVFHPHNHTVTQSSFAAPCVPLAISSNGTEIGFKSGFHPVEAGVTTPDTFNIMVNDTTPIWIYCGQHGHCQGGMSMVINQNASSGKTLEAYKAAAALVPIPQDAPAGGSSSVYSYGYGSTSTSVVTAAATSAPVFVSATTLAIGSSTGTAPAVGTPSGSAVSARQLGGRAAGVLGFLFAVLAFCI